MNAPAPNLAPDLVKELPTIGEFYHENGKDFVRISSVGSKDNLVRRVKPEHMAQFREQWNAFCDGQPPKQRAGTALAAVPGVNEEVAKHYVYQNVHTAEELAALNDMQCQSLGHGTLTFRASARRLLSERNLAAKLAAHDRVSDAMAKVQTAPDPQASADIAELKNRVSELTDGMKALVDMLAKQAAPKRRGRPARAKEADA